MENRIDNLEISNFKSIKLIKFDCAGRKNFGSVDDPTLWVSY